MSQLVRHPQATFFIRIQGDSMRDAGILHGSVVLVDKAIKAQHGNIVIAVVDGDFTCKRLDPADPLKLIIVTSKLLTGFDAPMLQAMNLDKTLRDHTPLQAICRVNRTYSEQKPMA